jgi:hypothetical protein
MMHRILLTSRSSSAEKSFPSSFATDEEIPPDTQTNSMATSPIMFDRGVPESSLFKVTSLVFGFFASSK